LQAVHTDKDNGENIDHFKVHLNVAHIIVFVL